MELNLVIFVQGMFCPFTEWFFKAITMLGEEGFVLLFFIGIFWLVNKRFAFNFATVYFASMTINGLLKVVAQRPRPYMESDKVLNLKQENSYSFPSGHSQTFATITMFSILEAKRKNKLVKTTAIITAILLALVLVSRMFLGQHYLSDVVAGAAIGLVVAYFGNMALSNLKRTDLVCIIISAITGLSIFVFATKMFDIGSNLINFFKFSALISSGYLAYFLEERFVKFDIDKVKKFEKIYIALIGFSVAVPLYLVIDMFVKMNILVFICYFALVQTLMILLPFVFKLLFNKGEKQNGRI